MYKKCSENEVDLVNKEAAKIVDNLDIADRVDAMGQDTPVLTAKDHKPAFETRPQFRLINRSKTNVGSISKKILDNINSELRSKTSLNQWKSTKSVLEWFKELPNKRDLKFIKLDIESFFPSITEKVLKDAIQWARNYISITPDDEEIIFHCRKTFLFNEECVWVKSNNAKFDVTQGSLDSAEVCELVGLYILHLISSLIPPKQYGIYRDDFLGAVRLTGRQVEQLNKKLHELFNNIGFKITIESNIQIVSFLDVKLNLVDGSFKPYRKNEEVLPVYIHVDSNHPPNTKKDLPKMISKRVSDLSSSKEVFDSEKNVYDQALNNAGYKDKLQYFDPNIPRRRQRKPRDILWYNPPWNDQVSTNIGKKFLELIDKHFGPASGSPLTYHLNRQKVKISYSCMPNLYSNISSMNQNIINPEKNLKLKGCNCTGGVDSCPMNGHCLTDQVVYQGDLKFKEVNPFTHREEEIHKIYIGSTATSFKTRYGNHKQTFIKIDQENKTTLSGEIWRLKRIRPDYDFDLKFSVSVLAKAYNRESKMCQLCLSEKTKILYRDKSKTINRRSELHAKCFHFEKHKLDRWI